MKRKPKKQGSIESCGKLPVGSGSASSPEPSHAASCEHVGRAQTTELGDGDLTARPIPFLVKNIAIPASVGLFFHTMYNVVDTFFAGRVSTQALAALSLSFPAFFLIIALGSGLGVGATALMGNALGAKDSNKASVLAVQGLVVSLGAGIMISGGGILISPFLFRSLGATGQYLHLCLLYMNIIFAGAAAFMLVYMSNAILQAQGNTRPHRNFLMAGFVANCVLDPWFIHGGLGVPAMGIGGVALATVLIQFGGGLYLSFRAWQSGLLKLERFSNLLPRWGVISEIARQGLPSSLNYMTIGLGIYVITFFVSDYGSVAVAAYGAAMRVEQIVLLPSIGLNIATLSLVAQNRGAGLQGRVWESMRVALNYGARIMAVGTVLVLLLARPLMSFFTDDQTVINIGTTYLRIDALVLYAYVVLFVHVAALQGVKRPMFGVWVGLLRQILFPAVVFYLMTKVFNVGLLGIWWGIFAITWAAAFGAAYVGRIYLTRVLAGDQKMTRHADDSTPG